jgi:uncharacterized protein YbaA (DUF1428 family)
MYHACYLFRVPADRIDQFLQIAAEAAKLYYQHGAISSSVSRITDGAAKYGCLGLLDQAPIRANEQLFIGIDSFPNHEKFTASMKQIDADPRIIELYHEMTKVIDLSRTIRWESEQVV